MFQKHIILYCTSTQGLPCLGLFCRSSCKMLVRLLLYSRIQHCACKCSQISYFCIEGREFGSFLSLTKVQCLQLISHLTPRRFNGYVNGKSCFDWAEIFSVTFFIYFKNIIFYSLIFYLALLKSYLTLLLFLFLNFLQCSV
jgi:hypothetical protein